MAFIDSRQAQALDEGLDQQYDRVTEILRSQSAPSPQQNQQQIDALALSSMAGSNFAPNAINNMRINQQQPIQNGLQLLEVLEAQKARGDVKAKALDDKISLFTGGDPEGTALFLEELHNDPEQIDPGNSYQVMTKLAGIKKRTGYESPMIAAQKQEAQLKLLKTQSEINKNDAMATKYRTSGNPAVKPMPAAALKLQQEALDIIGTASGINADLGSIEQQLSDKKLKLGPVSNFVNAGMNMAGVSSEESRNYASFKSTLEKLRNDSLRLNKGVQTEGDAVRAWNEILSNINDEELVQQRLAEVIKINERAADLQKLNVDQIRTNYGHGPLDVSEYMNRPSALGGAEDDTDLLEFMTPEERKLFE